MSVSLINRSNNLAIKSNKSNNLSLIEELKKNKKNMIQEDYEVLLEQFNYIEANQKKLGDSSDLIKKYALEILNSHLDGHQKVVDVAALSWCIWKGLNIKQLLKDTVNLSLFNYILDEFSDQIDQLKEQYYENLSHRPRFPSGKTNFCLNFFASLITLDSNKLLKGGVTLAEALLRHNMSNFSPDHAQSLLWTLQNLHKNLPSSKSVSNNLVHSSMKKWVCYVLKMPLDKSLEVYELNQAILMTLFSDIRQMGSIGNCFTISFINFIHYFSPQKLFELLKKLIETGSFRYDKDTVVDVNGYFIDFDELSNDTISQFGITSIQENHCFVSSLTLSGYIKPLTKKPDLNFNFTEFTSLFRTNKEFNNGVNFFISYKINPLQQILIKSFELLNNNTIVCLTKKYCFFQDIKEIFTENKHYNFNVDFLQKVLNFLYKNIFLVPVYDSTVEYNLNTQTVSTEKSSLQVSQITNLNKIASNNMKIVRLFSNFVVFVLKNNSIMLERNEELKFYLKKMIKEIAQTEDFKVEGLDISEEVKNIFYIIDSKQFIEQLKTFSQSVNSIVSENDLEEIQKYSFSSGGTVINFIDYYNLPLKSIEIQEKEPLKFFLKLCNVFKTNQHLFKQPYSNHQFPLMMRFKGHAFSITPNEFSSWWKGNYESEIKVDRLLVKKEELAARIISQAEMKRVLTLTLSYDDDTVNKYLLNFPSNQTVSWRDFIEKMKDKFSSIERNEFELNLWSVFTSVPFDNVKASLDKFISSSLGIKLNALNLELLLDCIEDKLGGYNHCSVLKIAEFTYKFLSKHLGRVEDLGYLEDALSNFYKVPQTIRFADSNHYGEGKERFHHKKYIIHADLITLKLKIYNRVHYYESALDKEDEHDFDYVQIFMPSVMNFERFIKV